MALEINGELIEDAVIRREAQLLKPDYTELFQQYDPITAEMHIRDLARERIIEQVLLRQEAARDPAPIAPEALDAALARLSRGADAGNCVTPMNEATLLDQAAADLRLDRMVGKIIAATPKPKHKELLDYYRKHVEEFDVPELAHAAHIIRNVDETHSEAEALAVLENVGSKLEAGVPFADLADEFSDCPGSGGDLGYFPRGQMVPEFDEVVFRLKPGQISPIFRTVFGFHIAKLIDLQPARRRSFDEAAPGIAEALHHARQRHVLGEFVAALRAKAQVRVVRKQS